ncbi:hypothetical protein VTP01DRAFT_4319 [Rhizomucor pusillus]|uniref:uncharacterized protein n=1 Tax=Rhizomucor pusillus TaxID=4840 RepID=UPI003743C696
MYLKTWDEFQKAAEELYAESPETTRYVSGFRHVDGELVLKVTNDQSIIKYKTKEAADLKKFANLNSRLMRKMQNVDIDESEASTAQAMEIVNSGNTPSATGPQIPEVVSTAGSTPASKPSPTPPTSQGKKKGNKKKRR